MQCYECIGINESFNANEIFGLNGHTYQKVTKHGRYKRDKIHGATLLTYSCLNSPRRLTCLARNTKSSLKELHYIIRTIDQMAEVTEKNKMAKFFNCNPEDIVRIE